MLLAIALSLFLAGPDDWVGLPTEPEPEVLAYLAAPEPIRWGIMAESNDDQWRFACRDAAGDTAQCGVSTSFAFVGGRSNREIRLDGECRHGVEAALFYAVVGTFDVEERRNLNAALAACGIPADEMPTVKTEN